MDKIRTIILSLLFILNLPGDLLAWQGVVTKVVSGDTLEVMKDQRKVKIQLYGAHAPQSDQPFSSEAKQFLSDLVVDKTVEIEAVDGSKPKQAMAIVTLEGKSINRKLLEVGLAWVDIVNCKRPECRQWQIFEAEAKSKKQGLWVDPNPTPPWEWKEKKTGGQSEGQKRQEERKGGSRK